MANQVNVAVPKGNHFRYPGEDRPVEIAAIFDQHGEIFLLDKLSRTVYWAHETGVPSYFQYLATGVDNYVDFDPEMKLLYHYPSHSGNRKNISFCSEEDLKKKLERAYPLGLIEVKECKTDKFELDYQSGSISTGQTREKFKVTMHQYYITFSSPEPATVRWELKFSNLELTFPNSRCPCMVYHARTLVDFINLCTGFGIEKLPDGRTMDDFNWMHHFQSNKIKYIKYDSEDLWIDNKMNGFYEDTPAMVMRFPRTGNTLHNIRKLRLFNCYAPIISFFGWQEDDDYVYLVFERTNWNFEDYVGLHPLGLSLLRDLALEVYELHEHKVTHGDLNPKNVFVRYNHKPKLGPPGFLTQGDIVYAPFRDIQSLAKLMLYYSSRGAYRFNNEVLTTEELDECKMPELRHLIEMLTSSSPPHQKEVVMLHPWILDTHAVIHLITTLSDCIEGNRVYESHVDQIFNQQNVFEAPWRDVLDAKFVNERSLARVQYPYDFERGSSLVRIMRNAFGHHKEMDKEVKKEVGKTKEEMLYYFRGKFPRFVLASYMAGKCIHGLGFAPNLKIFYEGHANIN